MMHHSYSLKERPKSKHSVQVKRLSFSLFLKAVHIPFHCHEWDDFLDFSRMSVPKDDWTVNQRLCKNLCRNFVGNYLSLWAPTMLITGMCLSRKLLFALIVIILTWALVSIMTLNIGSLHSGKTPTFKLLHDEKVSPIL